MAGGAGRARPYVVSRSRSHQDVGHGAGHPVNARGAGDVPRTNAGKIEGGIESRGRTGELSSVSDGVDAGADGLDRGLVERARDGDRAARNELVERLWPHIHRWSLVRTGDADDAADLAQRAAIRMLRHLDDFRGDAALSSWVYRIVRSTSVDDARRRERRRSREERYQRESRPHGAAVGTDGPEPEDELTRRRLRARVIEAFGTLTERQREIFEMVEFQGREPTEVAGLLDVAPSTVRVTLLRARRALREEVLRSDPALVEAFFE